MTADQTVGFEGVHGFLVNLFDGDLHAKRVLSLANATLGVIRTASLAVNTIGQSLPLRRRGGLALARGRTTKHAIKQVDRLLSNEGIDIDAALRHWVRYVVGPRTSINVAMDWTDFDTDGQATDVLVERRRRNGPCAHRSLPSSPQLSCWSAAALRHGETLAWATHTAIFTGRLRPPPFWLGYLASPAMPASAAREPEVLIRRAQLSRRNRALSEQPHAPDRTVACLRVEPGHQFDAQTAEPSRRPRTGAPPLRPKLMRQHTYARILIDIIATRRELEWWSNRNGSGEMPRSPE